MLEHGYEGVRQIEAHVTNTMGWSATTGQVQPWVYQKLTETFVLDAAMRERLARLNPTASAKDANRLIEASDRQFWKPDASVLEALRRIGTPSTSSRPVRRPGAGTSSTGRASITAASSA